LSLRSTTARSLRHFEKASPQKIQKKSEAVHDKILLLILCNAIAHNLKHTTETKQGKSKQTMMMKRNALLSCLCLLALTMVSAAADQLHASQEVSVVFRTWVSKEIRLFVIFAFL
jgi:Flp pilus assembly protein TadB